MKRTCIAMLAAFGLLACEASGGGGSEPQSPAKDVPATSDTVSEPDAALPGNDVTEPEPDTGTPDARAPETAEPLKCEEVGANAAGMIAKAVDSTADMPCAKHTECVLVPTSTPCAPTCGVVAHMDAAATITAGVTDAKNLCEHTGYASECPVVDVICEDAAPTCWMGKCTADAGPEPGCIPGTFKPAPGAAGCEEASCPNMQKAYTGLIESAVEEAQTCTASDECVIVGTGTECAGTCGAAVNETKKGPLLELLSWVDENICLHGDYASKCGYATPDCIEPNPGCVDGKCVYLKPGAPSCPPGMYLPYGGGDCTSATCDNMSGSVSKAIQSAVADAKKCTADAQCIIVGTGQSCWGDCGSAIHMDHKAAVEEVVAWVDEYICDANDYAGKCGYMTPGCMAPDPGCKDGLCVYAK